MLRLNPIYPTHAEQVMRDHVLETVPTLIQYLELIGTTNAVEDC